HHSLQESHHCLLSFPPHPSLSSARSFQVVSPSAGVTCVPPPAALYYFSKSFPSAHAAASVPLRACAGTPSHCLRCIIMQTSFLCPHPTLSSPHSVLSPMLTPRSPFFPIPTLPSLFTCVAVSFSAAVFLLLFLSRTIQRSFPQQPSPLDSPSYRPSHRHNHSPQHRTQSHQECNQPLQHPHQSHQSPEHPNANATSSPHNLLVMATPSPHNNFTATRLWDSLRASHLWRVPAVAWPLVLAAGAGLADLDTYSNAPGDILAGVALGGVSARRHGTHGLLEARPSPFESKGTSHSGLQSSMMFLATLSPVLPAGTLVAFIAYWRFFSPTRCGFESRISPWLGFELLRDGSPPSEPPSADTRLEVLVTAACAATAPATAAETVLVTVPVTAAVAAAGRGTAGVTGEVKADDLGGKEG
ncbi:unnamed protein product, partial [Closterium sp. NIES-54]